MDAERISQGLNPEQLKAIEAVRGPVCILAGAGSGKTTTITRRIANQVLTGAFEPGSILAVTFTDKAAGEMRGRLAALGVEGVRARTFHSAALAQLRHLSSEAPGRILPSKVLALRQLANSLPRAYRFRPAADLATEIEWARNRRITPDRYQGSLGSHEPPIPADLMAGIFRRYEDGKRAKGLIDFEDLLELAVRMFDRDEDARQMFQARYRAFTVDEYQDVNLLQQTLLERWLGGRDDICVVGDDYQSIYSFTGASPLHLLEMPKRFHGVHLVKLQHNYRSAPEVLEAANRLVPHLQGAEKVLEATVDRKGTVRSRQLPDPDAEQRYLVSEIQKLLDEGVPPESIAILYRINYRSEDHEEALSRANIPYQVRDGAFLSRQGARQLLRALRRKSSTEIATEVLAAAERSGYVEDVPDDVGEQELTRQQDLARLVRLAEQFDDGERTIADFVADLQARFGNEGEGRGVQLLTLHRAKGLEFDAVLLPRLQEGELPFKRSTTTEAIAEERRLLYVGMTRARTYLGLSWVNGTRFKPSRFLAELGLATPVATGRKEPSDVARSFQPGSWGEAAFKALKEWRAKRADADSVPAFVVFHDKTLFDIVGRRPASMRELALVPGIGSTKLERYGKDLLAVLEAAGKAPTGGGA